MRKRYNQVKTIRKSVGTISDELYKGICNAKVIFNAAAMRLMVMAQARGLNVGVADSRVEVKRSVHKVQVTGFLTFNDMTGSLRNLTCSLTYTSKETDNLQFNMAVETASGVMKYRVFNVYSADMVQRVLCDINSGRMSVINTIDFGLFLSQVVSTSFQVAVPV